MEAEALLTLEAWAALVPTELFLVCDMLTLGCCLCFVFSNETGDYSLGEKEVASGLVKAIGGQTGALPRFTKHRCSEA